MFTDTLRIKIDIRYDIFMGKLKVFGEDMVTVKVFCRLEVGAINRSEALFPPGNDLILGPL
jgi:hypothetical protein